MYLARGSKTAACPELTSGRYLYFYNEMKERKSEGVFL